MIFQAMFVDDRRDRSIRYRHFDLRIHWPSAYRDSAWPAPRCCSAPSRTSSLAGDLDEGPRCPESAERWRSPGHAESSSATTSREPDLLEQDHVRRGWARMRVASRTTVDDRRMDLGERSSITPCRRPTVRRDQLPSISPPPLSLAIDQATARTRLAHRPTADARPRHISPVVARLPTLARTPGRLAYSPACSRPVRVRGLHLPDHRCAEWSPCRHQPTTHHDRHYAYIDSPPAITANDTATTAAVRGMYHWRARCRREVRLCAPTCRNRRQPGTGTR